MIPDAAQALQALLAPQMLRPLNSKVLDKWLSLRGGSPMLPRAAFTPREFAFALSHICLAEVRPAEDVILRLCGTAITEMLGRELTGAGLRGLTPEPDWPYRLSVFERILKGEAFVGVHSFQLPGGSILTSQELILPFAESAAGSARQALIVNDFLPAGYYGHAELPDGALRLTSEDQFFTL